MSFATATETELKKQCLHYLHLQGVFAWVQNSGATKIGNRFIRFTSDDAKGISDIIGVMPDGRFVAIETKLPGAERKYNAKAKVRLAEQKEFVEAVKRRGGVAGVVHSLDELQTLLEASSATEKPQDDRWVAE